jgi:hypothetical protein
MRCTVIDTDAVRSYEALGELCERAEGIYI